jgi:hypothetical protein
MKSQEEFREYYSQVMLPRLAGLEARRKTVLTMVAALGALSLGLVIWTALMLLPAAMGDEDLTAAAIWSLFPAVFGAGLWAYGYPTLTRGYMAEFKEELLGELAGFIDEGLSYSPRDSVPQDEYVRSGIFHTLTDRYRGWSLFSGRIGATKLRFSELHTQYKEEYRDDRGRRRTEWHTIFRGVFFAADFNKHFKAETFVLPDTAERLLGTVVGQMMQKHTIGRPPLVKLEDPEFEKYFVVYSEDQIEARYILSPSLMERITAYRKKTGSKVYLSFVADKVYVAIPHEEELFRPWLLKPVSDYKLDETFLESIRHFSEIVDDLNLNTRIWGKE